MPVGTDVQVAFDASGADVVVLTDFMGDAVAGSGSVGQPIGVTAMAVEIFAVEAIGDALVELMFPAETGAQQAEGARAKLQFGAMPAAGLETRLLGLNLQQAGRRHLPRRAKNVHALTIGQLQAFHVL